MPSEQQAPAWTNDDHFTYFRMKVSGHSNLVKHAPELHSALYIYFQYHIKPTQIHSESVLQPDAKLAPSCNILKPFLLHA